MGLNKGNNMAKINFYAIRSGRECNVIKDTWDECSKLVTGFKGAEFKGFTNKAKAVKYIKESPGTANNDLALLIARLKTIKNKDDIASLGQYIEDETEKLKYSVSNHNLPTILRHATNVAAAAILVGELAKTVKA